MCPLSTFLLPNFKLQKRLVHLLISEIVCSCIIYQDNVGHTMYIPGVFATMCEGSCLVLII